MQQVTQKDCKSTYESIRNVIFWVFHKKLNFERASKWYMHKLESFLESKRKKNVLDFEIEAYHETPTRKPDQVLFNKKK